MRGRITNVSPYYILDSSRHEDDAIGQEFEIKPYGGNSEAHSVRVELRVDSPLYHRLFTAWIDNREMEIILVV